MKIIYDHRQRLSNTRNQGSRPTCLAFAASAANEFKNHELTEYLSAEYLYQKSLGLNNSPRGLTPSEVRKALRMEGQPIESVFPYGTISGKISSTSQLYKSESKVLDVSPSKIHDILSSGDVPIIGVRITKSFYKPEPPHFLVRDEFANYTGRHALLVVGMATVSKKEHFLIRNSWGTNWGDQGHAWLSIDYIKINAFMGLQLTA